MAPERRRVVAERVVQPLGPLFSSVEMANADVPTFIGRLRSVPYFTDLVAAAALAFVGGVLWLAINPHRQIAARTPQPQAVAR